MTILKRDSGDVSRLEAEGYLRVRGTLLPAAQAVLALEPELLDEAIAFAEAGVAKLRDREKAGGVDRAGVDRAGNELDVLRAVARFRKELATLAEGQAARARLTEGIVDG